MSKIKGFFQSVVINYKKCAVAPYFGYPTHYLFLAIAGGVGFLALGAASLAHLRSLRSRVVPAASGAATGASGAPSRG